MTAPIDLLPWESIEGANKDGRKVLLRDAGSRYGTNVLVARWHGTYNCWMSHPGDYRLRFEPTHWLDISDAEPNQ